MNLDDYRTLFVVGSLALILAAASPGLNMIVPFLEGREEKFTELWILGPDNEAEGYPFNIEIDESQGPVYLGVRNRLGYTAYYLVYMKVRNGTQPSANRTRASPLDPVYEFRFVLSDGGEWKRPVVFSLGGQPDNISTISVNGLISQLVCTSEWNSSRGGFYYQLFFELWLYDEVAESFQFHNRFVSLWLNVTSV